jgi:hypothetical protein
MPDALLVCVTDVKVAATATVQGAGRYRVQCDLIKGWSDLVVYAPPDQPSIALEPLTCALSAASIDDDVSAVMPSLPPGQRVAAVLRLAIAQGASGLETSLPHP